MPEIIQVSDIARYDGQEVTVQGWVRTRRDSKAFSFLELNDGTCLGNLQIVADAGIPGYDTISKMNTGASVEVRGKLIPSPAAGQLPGSRQTRFSGGGEHQYQQDPGTPPASQ